MLHVLSRAPRAPQGAPAATLSDEADLLLAGTVGYLQRGCATARRPQEIAGFGHAQHEQGRPARAARPAREGRPRAPPAACPALLTHLQAGSRRQLPRAARAPAAARARAAAAPWLDLAPLHSHTRTHTKDTTERGARRGRPRGVAAPEPPCIYGLHMSARGWCSTLRARCAAPARSRATLRGGGGERRRQRSPARRRPARARQPPGGSAGG